MAWIAKVGGPLLAFIGTFLLVAGIPQNPKWFVRCLPCMLLPACVYYSATLACYLTVIDHYNQVCKGYVLYAIYAVQHSTCVVSGGGCSSDDEDKAEIKNFKNRVVNSEAESGGAV